LYRHLIAGLSDRFRCVAVDYPGFGLSTARAGYGFRPADHARVVAALVDVLRLDNITFVVNDWGGPIGFWVAGEHPERVAGFVIANTWGWPVTSEKQLKLFSQLVGGPVGRMLIRRFNLFVNALVPRGHTRTTLTRTELEHYRRRSRTATERPA
jgi:haloalkane dehalogenase